MQLTLIVENTKDLSGGASATCNFDAVGGTIGSSEDNLWQLSDGQGAIDPQHMRIFQADGFYCGEVLSQAGITINGSSRPAKTGTTFQIKDGDRFDIGDFRISAAIRADEEDANSTTTKSWLQKFSALGSIVPGADRQSSDGELSAEALLNGGGTTDTYMHLKPSEKKKTDLDPMVHLEDATGSTDTFSDPLAAIDYENQMQETRELREDALSHMVASPIIEPVAAAGVNDPTPDKLHFDLPRIKSQGASDVTNDTNSAEVLVQSDAEMQNYIEQLNSPNESMVLDNNPKTYKELDDYESWTGNTTADAGDASAQNTVDHVVLRPLLKAMNIPIQEMSVPEANRLTREIGEAVVAAINGIIAIHRVQRTDRSLVNETQLHLVEDNPLRLEQNPENAMRDLFLSNSPVHLNASSAISESFDLICQHETSSRTAIESALTSVLNALAPANLARRFAKYRGHSPRTGNLDAWHWQMYQHYYSELKTDRQRGLGRMFWEVYQQVYAENMRKKAMEE